MTLEVYDMRLRFGAVHRAYDFYCGQGWTSPRVCHYFRTINWSYCSLFAFSFRESHRCQPLLRSPRCCRIIHATRPRSSAWIPVTGVHCQAGGHVEASIQGSQRREAQPAGFHAMDFILTVVLCDRYLSVGRQRDNRTHLRSDTRAAHPHDDVVG